MLVLQRKRGESVLIGENLRITVIECARDGVRLAIDAPRSMHIVREELGAADEENKASMGSSTYAKASRLQDMLFAGRERQEDER